MAETVVRVWFKRVLTFFLYGKTKEQCFPTDSTYPLLFLLSCVPD